MRELPRKKRMNKQWLIHKHMHPTGSPQNIYDVCSKTQNIYKNLILYKQKWYIIFIVSPRVKMQLKAFWSYPKPSTLFLRVVNYSVSSTCFSQFIKETQNLRVNQMVGFPVWVKCKSSNTSEPQLSDGYTSERTNRSGHCAERRHSGFNKNSCGRLYDE